MKTLRYLMATLMLPAIPAVAQAQGKTPEPSPLFTHPTFIILAVTAVVLMAVIVSLSSAMRNLSESGRQKLKDNRKGNSSTAGVLTLLFALGSVVVQAQAAATPAAETVQGSNYMPPAQIGGIDSWVFLILTLVVVVEFIAILGLIRAIRNLLIGLGYQAEPEEAKVKPLINWKWLDSRLTDAVPLEREAEIMTDHEYDGIKELDNNLPPWWKYGFYFTIIFSVVYLFDYHVLHTSPSQLQEYNQQMADAEVEKKARLKNKAAGVDETTVTMLSDAAAIAAGKEIYDGNCASCHGTKGEGLVGPNLTDAYWLHGGGIQNVFKSIKYGIPAKGMIAWQSQLSAEAMQKVSSYIMTLGGTKPANAKEPQGELWAGDTAPATDSTAVKTDSTATAMAAK